MSLVLLTVPALGKSYLDRNNTNVYDFDKHSLDYKWDRTGFEHLSDEEFKGLPNRKMKENWEEIYSDDFIALIKSNQYEIVTGWLQDFLIDRLIEEGIEFRIILGSKDFPREELISRLNNRGNNKNHISSAVDYFYKCYYKYTSPEFLTKIEDKGVVIDVLNYGYLTDYLILEGYILKNTVSYNYVKFVNGYLYRRLKIMHDDPYGLVRMYSFLVLLSLDSGICITNEMVHSAWSFHTNNVNDGHRSLILYNKLSKEFQDLDTYYTDMLNDVCDEIRNLYRRV